MSSSISIRTSWRCLFESNRDRQERLNALADALEHGSEGDYINLLIGWSVPAESLHRLLNEFRRHRREKRGLVK